MVQINGKDYVTVAERLALLHDQYDNVMIETEILRFDEEIVLVKAVLKIEEKQFIGHAQEIIGSSKVNSTSALENAETSAVGRALAFAGFGVHGGIASADEIFKAENRTSKVSETKEIATENQMDKIKSLLHEPLITDPERERIKKIIADNTLDKRSASDLLSYFYGKSSVSNGSWKKVTQGVLSERRVSANAA